MSCARNEPNPRAGSVGELSPEPHARSLLWTPSPLIPLRRALFRRLNTAPYSDTRLADQTSFVPDLGWRTGGGRAATKLMRITKLMLLWRASP